jgi:hypothetical protein
MTRLLARVMHVFGRHDFVDCVMRDSFEDVFEGRCCRICGQLGDHWTFLESHRRPRS